MSSGSDGIESQITHLGGSMAVFASVPHGLEALKTTVVPITNYSESLASLAFASEDDPCPLLHVCICEIAYA